MNATSGELLKQLFDALHTRLVAAGDYRASDFEQGGRVGKFLDTAALVLKERGGKAVIEDLLTHIKNGRGDWAGGVREQLCWQKHSETLEIVGTLSEVDMRVSTGNR